jgi:uncharacterized protein (TIGR02118 family)
MVKLTVLYGQPQDPRAFDRHYQQVHAPSHSSFQGSKVLRRTNQ